MTSPKRWYRLKILLALSLVYGCGTRDPISGEGPAGYFQLFDFSDYKLLSAGEIDQLKASGLVEANNRFGFDLFKQIYEQAPGQNHFYSPVSVALALQMALQGADADTLNQMRRVLKLENIDNKQLLQAVPLLVRKLHRPTHDVTLETANSLWLSPKFNFKADFLAAVQKPFDAELAILDSNPAQAVNRINAWAAKTTHDKIPTVISNIDPQTAVAYLLNALYFKASWTYRFDKAETQPDNFYLEAGDSKQVEMMRQFGDFLYHPPRQDFPHQGLRLPYGQAGKLAMYVFMPSAGQNLASLQKDLQSSEFATVRSTFYRETGSIRLPKFTLNQEQRLNQHLLNLGMPLALDKAQANFSKIAALKPEQQGNIFLSDIQQKAFVDVNEEGTEAAVVTSVGFSFGPSSAPPRLDIKIDHPFMFLIRDDDTGQILFMGSITDPTAGSAG
ncbi:MAG: serpin family protein [Candidatus Sericytochromatia bacterium]